VLSAWNIISGHASSSWVFQMKNKALHVVWRSLLLLPGWNCFCIAWNGNVQQCPSASREKYVYSLELLRINRGGRWVINPVWMTTDPFLKPWLPRAQGVEERVTPLHLFDETHSTHLPLINLTHHFSSVQINIGLLTVTFILQSTFKYSSLMPNAPSLALTSRSRYKNWDVSESNSNWMIFKCCYSVWFVL